MVETLGRMVRRLIARMAHAVGFHAQLAASAGLILGLSDGVWGAATVHVRTDAAALLGAGLFTMLAAIAGVMQGLLAVPGGWLSERLGWMDSWRAAMTRSRNDLREPVISFHAKIVSAVVVGAVACATIVVCVANLERIKDESLRENVLAMLSIGTFVIAIVGTQVLVPLIALGLAKLDSRWALPLPKWPLLRFIIYLFLPVCAVVFYMGYRYGEKLGILTPLFATVLFFATQGLLEQFRRALRRTPVAARPRLLATLAWSWRLLLLSAAVSSVYLFERWPSSRDVALSGYVLPMVTNTMRRITDVDGDGISSMFGGDDCAPFDASRSPTQLEIPENGVDEDCDGRDPSAKESLLELRHYYGRLKPYQKRRGKNVLWVVVDSLRPDHLTPWGYKEKTTPFLRKLARESWVFLKAYSQSSTTALSIPSMLAGRRPGSLNWVPGSFPGLKKSEPLILDVLARHGYPTSFVGNAWFSRKFKSLTQRFATTHASPASQDWKSGEYILSHAFVSMQRSQTAGQPFFLMLHMDDAHHPYKSHRGKALPDFKNETTQLAAYDRGIANVDNLLSMLVAYLKAVSLWEETILIVTADHGEEFNEHGHTIHSSSCYVESVHVPLIVRIPGFRHKRIRNRVALTDIVPTLIEALDLPFELLSVDGQSLFMPVLSPRSVDRDRPIFCSIFQLMSGRKNFFTRSVRAERYILIQELLSGKRELYDTIKDPGERVNLIQDSRKQQLVDRLSVALRASLRSNLFGVRKFK